LLAAVQAHLLSKYSRISILVPILLSELNAGLSSPSAMTNDEHIMNVDIMQKKKP
jgi:hypothetical protein